MVNRRCYDFRAIEKVNKLASQIDLLPTLFSFLDCAFSFKFFGKDILAVCPEDKCTFV
jgi:phosphoglycerol transferase MdoB-like AlkP superfamily enzyme